MNIIEVLTFPLGVVTLVLFIAALWQINKGRSKRITYTMRIGFGAILVYYLLYASQSYVLTESASNLTVESYRTAMTVLYSIGCTLFAWGFFLLAKEYRDQ
jgi:uncharacterized membrane protein YozB (DUF420 family)